MNKVLSQEPNIIDAPSNNQFRQPASAKAVERKKWDSFGDNVGKNKPLAKNFGEDDQDIAQDDDKDID